jgi:hypothetical protein
MPEQHLTDLIRDYGRSLLYGRHPGTRAKRRDETPSDEGVRAARTSFEKDDNPYSPNTPAYEDWEAGFESSLDAAKACDLD